MSIRLFYKLIPCSLLLLCISAVSYSMNLDQQLVSAVQSNNVAKAKELLDAGANVNITFSYSKTPLIFAAEKGYLDLAKVILAAKPDLSRRDRIGFTALTMAANKGHADIVDALIAAGADVNMFDGNGGTPILRASEKGDTSSVRLLIAAGADVNKGSSDNSVIPLISAAAGGHPETVDALIKARANLNAVNRYRNTALILASNAKATESAKLLIEAGADVNIIGDRHMTALMHALGNNNIELIKALLGAGADPNISDMHGKQLLNLALSNPELIKMLRRAGAKVDPTEKSQYYSKPPLPAAISSNNYTAALALIDPVITSQVSDQVKTLLMIHKRPDSPLSALPKDMIKLIISTAFPEYTIKTGMDPQILAKQDVEMLVDRMPLDLLAQAVKAGALDRQAVIDAWKRKLATIGQALNNAKSVGAGLIQNFEQYAIAHIEALLQDDKQKGSAAVTAAASP